METYHRPTQQYCRRTPIGTPSTKSGSQKMNISDIVGLAYLLVFILFRETFGLLLCWYAVARYQWFCVYYTYVTKQ